MAFKKNQWYRVRIRVTDAAIEAWIDDEQVVHQPRKGHKFGIRSEVELCRPLGISTWITKGAVRNIRIRPLDVEKKRRQAEYRECNRKRGKGKKGNETTEVNYPRQYSSLSSLRFLSSFPFFPFPFSLHTLIYCQ